MRIATMAGLPKLVRNDELLMMNFELWMKPCDMTAQPNSSFKIKTNLPVRGREHRKLQDHALEPAKAGGGAWRHKCRLFARTCVWQSEKLTRLLTYARSRMKRVKDIRKLITPEAVKTAAERAFRGHSGKPEVARFKAAFEENCEMLYTDLKEGRWERHISYRKLEKTNKNGKRRKIDCPSLETRVYQDLFLGLIEPVYFARDPNIGLNCKPGCGITATDRRKSVLRRLKHLYYDRRDLHYCLVMDQRECYKHSTPSSFRPALKQLVDDRWFVDFAVGVCFVDGRLPIGTPTSPMAHHILMLGCDRFSREIAPFALRYADNLFLAFATKEEAQAAKWRMKNFWWYRLGLRAKRGETAVLPLSLPLDFCGYVFHRREALASPGLSPSLPAGHPDKGYVTIRRSTARSARRCRDDHSWASYFGLMRHADTFSLMVKIEKDMKLRELTRTIRIDRRMDARHVEIRDLVGIGLTIYDYEIRYNSQKEPNWVKCLVGVDEVVDGQATGKVLAFEFHGNYQGIVQFLAACEKEYGKEAMLPIEEVEIENQCGFIFKESTNQIKYIEA